IWRELSDWEIAVRQPGRRSPSECLNVGGEIQRPDKHPSQSWVDCTPCPFQPLEVWRHFPW
ncbi:hypothetical protein chiPu_0023243, partial [Chiloscyllium punctatum]|nr:hypothetical protein [Chiloscyllium punctatum]